MLDFLLVPAEDSCALSVEVSFNRLQLLVVVLSHLSKLRLHSRDQGVDILAHLLDGLDVVAILLIDLCLKFSDQLSLIRDDLGACSFLSLDIL